MMKYHEKVESGRASKQLLILFLFIIVCMCFLSCDAATFPVGPSSYQGAEQSTGAQGVQIFVQPEAGEEVILDAIANAKRSVWVKVYLLTNRDVIDALKTAVKQNKEVRVMLEEHPFGGGGLSPRETMSMLKSAGIQVKFANPKFRFTHEKSMVIDGSTAYIMTLNLTQAALGQRNREYGIIDTNPDDVQAVMELFENDWNRTEARLDNPHMVVSPINARRVFTSLIKEAQETLLIEAETMDDDQIEQELIRADQRGVDVQVIVPDTLDKDDRQGVRMLKRSGVLVHEVGNPYMHAKIILVDGKKAFVGSVNISTNSLERNRELGILVSDQNVVRVLFQTFQEDWQEAG